jgi:hypothetical protein
LHEASQEAISLRELSLDEVLAIEMFALASFAEMSGLPGPERDRAERSVGREHSLTEINELFVQRGLSPLPV